MTASTVVVEVEEKNSCYSHTAEKEVEVEGSSFGVAQVGEDAHHNLGMEVVDIVIDILNIVDFVVAAVAEVKIEIVEEVRTDVVADVAVGSAGVGVAVVGEGIDAVEVVEE